MRSYVRFAALGDSTTHGIGDPVPDGWRGWARLLATAMDSGHDISFCNLAVSGATATDVRDGQLRAALAHQPDVASLVVGINDTMRSTWHPPRMRAELFECADALHGSGALLLTARFHDHGAIFGLPGVLRRALWRRIEAVNAIYDEIHETYDGVRVDLAALPQTHERVFWSVDRLHPSELGHRALARAFGAGLLERGLDFELPSATSDGLFLPNWRSDLAWMVTEGAPWIGRRARDLGPWAVRRALVEPRTQRPAAPAVPVAGPGLVTLDP
ncbi:MULTISPECIES: SGNH/GDSL hydrolase family protein [unclassified Nocardioides]|uniref:SGNH/GDSL hydrolase family protein n=1 Tax=unclassified Nocardioides TaxID=2615069 RepID=UPI0006F31A62|nr:MULTISPECIES: SGNH/GDSL hydrolase family protein [unclassified Nocardioides]KQY63566.1 GDSL family lipase [Nocardioides sp. Root140]KRF18084.1 GDSL family lipase [Nocardioides sp. Soil796]